MGANPEHVCDEHEFSFPEGTNDYCVACGMRKVDYERFVKLEAEVEWLGGLLIEGNGIFSKFVSAISEPTEEDEAIMRCLLQFARKQEVH